MRLAQPPVVGMGDAEILRAHAEPGQRRQSRQSAQPALWLERRHLRV
jgi:hypothetical protein